MSYKAVFFDIDGTLINEEKQIPNTTREAVERLKGNGVDVFIATGRAPSQFRFVADEFGIDSFVTCNGGYAEYRGKPVFGNPIPRHTLQLLSEQAHESGHALVFAGSDACYATVDQHPFVTEAFDYLKIVKKPEFSPDVWKETDIYQVYLYCEEPKEQPYIERFPNLNFIRAHKLYLDLFPKDVSKAGGIEAMLHHLKLTPEQVVAFGDGMNDVQMLSYVGMGIAMGNARDEVKSYAKFITKDVNNGGILYGLEKIGLLSS
ncbi:Cof-type HAD-IIB family hydrolase [Alicyclobacillus dauci]|uniref:Cof-type HAD-IIB family hydrolase n=1 Tax=Alicyclobacillus dauci TaxID=1475485 RepID=A0ABY6Z787_9BACL|nr:Cof-type HAD-IIB family hydrolase [Alicyclobacillus dauci]WAH38388.1 Cof-type HAD-IIB family hydrolase [Alicyclobacillus dauci]